MNYKHHQAIATKQQQNSNTLAGASFSSYLNVYNTRFTVPSVGVDYYVFDEPLDTDGAYEAPDYKGYTSTGLVSYGKHGNLIFDWEGGGPDGVRTNRWQVLLQGATWGSNPVASTEITFKAVYSGNLVLSVNTSVAGDYTNTPTGNLSSVLIDDWDYTAGNQVKSVTTASVNLSGGGAISSGGISFRARYWNGAENPHLLLFIKRTGVDKDFVLMGASSLTTTDTVYGTPIAAGVSQITDLPSWSIKRDHDQITKADILVHIDDANDPNAYDTSLEKFGPIRKGSYVELFAGYDGVHQKRFVGNVVGGTEVSRNKNGAEVLLQCECPIAAMLDTVNFSFPNNATYSFSEYFTDDNLFTEPDGVTRPRQFDQWDLNKAIRALALQSDVDDYYLQGTRKHLLENGTVVDSNIALIRDIGINLSRASLNPRDNVNAPVLDPIWVYDFGQDTAFDIAKDMISKYGFYLADIAGGDDCGKFELIEVQSPILTTEALDAVNSSNYTEGIKRESMEGFLGVQMDTGTSNLVLDWTGSTVDIIMAIGPSLNNGLSIQYKGAPGDPDWTNVAGIYHNGEFSYSYGISTQDTNLEHNIYFHDGIDVGTGYNICVFRPVFGVDEFGFLDTGLGYGEHKLRIRKTTTAIALFDSIKVYDYEDTPYKKYSTYDMISSLSSRTSVADIRNDIVVLGATYGAFSHTADPDIVEEAKDRYITSRAVDTRSIHDPSYKYYIGRRKQFVIEDPTIVTQERADWLSLYVLQEYRQSPVTSTINIPADMGIQLYDGILIEDTKTQSVDDFKNLKVESISENFTKDGYTMDIGATSRLIPISFRPRQQLTPELVALHFNNCPIAFEKMWVPVRDGNTGYDPMSSEDGVFIEFEWTQLVPGKVNMEVYDRSLEHFSGDDIHGPNYGQGNEEGGFTDQLLAVPYIAQSDTIGKYRARWDGVHECFDDPKFSGTLYEIDYQSPQGSGFFCRTLNTPVIDSIDPVAFQNEEYRKAKVCYFPAYPVAKYQPVEEGFEEVKNTYYFGEENGTSEVNGLENPTDDTSMFEIGEFDIEPRTPLFWGFNEEYIIDPLDGEYFKAYTDHPYEQGEDPDILFQDSQLNSGPDTTHKVMHFDPRLPRGNEAPHEPVSGYITRTMPVADDTIGVRMFVDSDVPNPRRFRVLKADIEINVLTLIADTMTHNVSSYKVTWVEGSARSATLPHPSKFKRAMNYFNRYSVTVPITKFHNSVQKVVIGEWTYLPTFESRNDPESEMFKINPSHSPQVLYEMDPLSVREANTKIAGIGVGKVFAIDVSKMNNFDLGDLEYGLNKNNSYIPYKHCVASTGQTLYTVLGGSLTTPSEFFYPRNRTWEDADGVYASPASAKDWMITYSNFGYGTSPNINYYNAYLTIDRKIWNSIIMSLDFQIIDRAGRLYHCVSKADEGQFIIGRHNEVEAHSEYSRALMPYVNRWNPYLPSVSYRERDLDGWSLDNFGGSRFDEMIDHINTSIVKRTLKPNFASANLTQKILNHGMTSDNYYPVQLTHPYPLESLHNNNSSRYGQPILYTFESADGKPYGYFGSVDGLWNSYAFIAGGVQAPGSRDNTIDGNTSCWGLPLYVIGAYPYDTNDLPYPDKQSHAGGTYAQWNWYLRDRAASGATMRIEHQRGGLATFLNNSPVFTFIGGSRLAGDVAL